LKKKFWNFKNQSNSAADLYFYGEISEYSWWGDEVTPKSFKADLDALGDIAELNIYINSPGGDVFAAQAIYSMLKRHKSNKCVYIDGLAASAASVVALAGDKVIMPINSMLMIHNPWTIGIGSSADFRKLADDLDKIRESIVAVYRDKTGLTDEDIISLMDAETWMTAEDAYGYGFADEVKSEKKVAASMKGDFFICNGLQFDVGKFAAFPRNSIPVVTDEPVISTPVIPELKPEQKNKAPQVNSLQIYDFQCRINERRLKHGLY
jgi:ATP-dependent Clp protease protease subunit